MHSRSSVTEQVALVRHHCDICNHPIFPGDSYFRIFTVRIHGPYRAVFIRKEHDSPGCMYDPEDHPDMLDDTTLFMFEALSMAA